MLSARSLGIDTKKAIADIGFPLTAPAVVTISARDVGPPNPTASSALHRRNIKVFEKRCRIRRCRMRLIFAGDFPQFCCHWQKALFPILLVVAVWPSGCGNTCFAFISNPSSGTLKIAAGDARACTLAPASSTVHLVVQTI